MLIKTLVVLQVCLLLGQAEQLTRYRSQTAVDITLKPSDGLKLCECAGGKCTMVQSVADEACKVFMQRFQAYMYPSGYALLCEFLPESCTDLQGNAPKAYHLRAIFDTYSLRNAPFYNGPDSLKFGLVRLFSRNHEFKHTAFDTPPVAINLAQNISGMPIEFDGEVEIPTTEIGKFHLCYSADCHKAVNTLCHQFSESMKAVVPDLMAQFIGCSVKGIYQAGGKVRASWAMLFEYHALRLAKTITTWDSLAKILEKINAEVKPTAMVKKFHITGIKPLDFCEITATAQTPLPFNKEMGDTSSLTYRSTTQVLYKDLARQFQMAAGKNDSCVRNIIEMRLSDSGGLTSAESYVWVSLTCYEQKGIKECKEVVNDIAEVWKKGSQRSYSPLTPEYKFKLFHFNLALNE